MRRTSAACLIGAAFVVALSAVACSSGGGNGSGEQGGSGGAGGAGSGGGGGDVKDPAEAVYPDIAALHALGVSRTCSLNEGVCHAARQYPELGGVQHLLDIVNAPCQVAAAEPSLVPDECERPGDKLVLGGVNYEILFVTIDPSAPFPPTTVTLTLAGAPSSLDTNGAKIRRLDDSGAEVLSVPLGAVSITPGTGAKTYVLGLGTADPVAKEFLDVRVTGKAGEGRVRVGDANGNGMAHASASPWSLVVPGDPGRSYLYKRLLSDKLGPRMPMLERTWSALATRAMYCWIRGMSPDATAASLSIHDPIDYASCPLDPDAPDPGATGTWASVRTLMGSRCATAGCHTEAAKAGGLNLSPEAATISASVINAPSTQSMGALLVVPGQPASSYLLCKLDPKCESRAPMTAVMPITGTPLTDAEIESVSKWIQAGAKIE